MQISRLYSNKPQQFTPIHFNAGDNARQLNVIFAEVHKRVKQGDSHNLGKTTLIALIDFLLLKDIAGSDHFLAVHNEKFGKFVFFLELAIWSGGFVTIRRSPAEPNKIALVRTNTSLKEAGKLPESKWNHWDAPLSASRQALNAYLDLTAITPWDYRTGVSYFLRTQEDFSEYFQISKFMRGQDRAWKPYLARVLGLDYEAVMEKYTLEEQIQAKQTEYDHRLAEIAPHNRNRGELATRLEILRDEISQIDARLDVFDFHEVEIQVSKTVVDTVEAKLQTLSEEIYNLDVDIAQLEASISAGIKFDIKRIKQIFNECKVEFPAAITKSYEELESFNKQLTRERNSALRTRLKELYSRRDAAIEEHAHQSAERQRMLAVIKEVDTFKKYKSLQKEQAQRRAMLAFLESEMERLHAVSEIERTLRDLRSKKDDATTDIEKSLEHGSPQKTSVTTYFNRYVKQVLGIAGEFIVSRNSSGNIEFSIRTKDIVGQNTSQDKGHSYRRLLCALFDLAVLKTLEDAAFYHFVYHDGILEGLDDRVKNRFLTLVREIIGAGKIQYILSVIDSDLPRDLTNQQVRFPDDEIVLTLSDRGDSGRLFKMSF